MQQKPLEVIDNCQSALVSFEVTGRKALYELLALIYSFAQMIEKDEVLRRKFFEKQFWIGRTYKPNRQKLLRHVFRFCMKAEPPTTGYDRACSYARALEDFFNEGVPAGEVAERIHKAGGVEQLEFLAKQTGQNAAVKSIQSGFEENDEEDDEEDNNDDKLFNDNDEESEVADADSDRSADGQPHNEVAGSASERSLSNAPRFDPRKHLLIETSDKQLFQLLARRRDGVLSLMVERELLESGWVNLRVIELN